MKMAEIGRYKEEKAKSYFRKFHKSILFPSLFRNSSFWVFQIHVKMKESLFFCREKILFFAT